MGTVRGIWAAQAPRQKQPSHPVQMRRQRLREIMDASLPQPGRSPQGQRGEDEECGQSEVSG